MKNFLTFREEIDAKSFLMIAEKEMSSAQKKKREEIAQSMSDEDFKKRYGKDWMSVKMATATKQAMKEASEEAEESNEEEIEEGNVDKAHYCATHVEHSVYGEGTCIKEAHAEPDEDGNIEWYAVEFKDGVRKVFTEKLNILQAENHMHSKKKKMAEAKIKHPNQQVLDVHEPEKDELTAKDFEMLRKNKKARAK